MKRASSDSIEIKKRAPSLALLNNVENYGEKPDVIALLQATEFRQRSSAFYFFFTFPHFKKDWTRSPLWICLTQGAITENAFREISAASNDSRAPDSPA